MLLRVFLTGPASPDRRESWIRYADDGSAAGAGEGKPGAWPAASRIEIVLAASALRLVAIALPPLPAAKLHSAARYAIGDQLATPTEESIIALAQRHGDGPLLAAVASAARVRSIAASIPNVARMVPESALAPPRDGWLWCRSAEGGGFVRRSDGSAFSVSDADEALGLPAELAAALAQAKRAGSAPESVHAALTIDTAQLARAAQTTGVRFAPSPPWRWNDASLEAFASAPDLLGGADVAGAALPGRASLRIFRPAMIIAAAALALHVGALLVQRTWLGIEDWRVSRALIAQAADAGLPAASDAEAAAATIARRHVELRHRASQSAPGDALPLLARAAPVLAGLPPGTLKSATYRSGAWTLDLRPLPSGTGPELVSALANAGVDTQMAASATGARMRLALDAASP